MTTDIVVIDDSNKSEIIKTCTSTTDKILLREVIYKACLQVVIGDVNPDLLISVFAEIIKSNGAVINVLCDVLSVLDIESQVLEKHYRKNFIQFINHSNNKIISDWLFKERLEYATIDEAGIISNSKQASTKFIKLKTKLYYKQQKFNLFREESEGYSKLLTELSQDGEFEPRYMLDAIKSLIGCFNLDPNRVLDIILECFETRLHLRDSFISLIKCFSSNSSTLNQILAFKFSFFNSDIGIEAPSELYDVTALILHNGLIDVDKLYSYLTTTDSKICEIHKNEIAEAKSFPRKVAAILSEEGAKHEDINIYEDVKLKRVESNQKLGLIRSLIRIGNWSIASKLMNRLPEYFAVSYPEISDSLCALIHFMVDPFYKKCSALPPSLSCRLKSVSSKTILVGQIDNLEDFKSQIMPMLFAFGPYLYRDTLLLTKLIRVLRTILQTDYNFRYEVLNLLNITILPSFSLVESNSALVEELWTLLRLFQYNERYLLYNNWKTEPTSPLLIKMKFFNIKRIKYIMKRLSKDKDSIKQSGRLIGKLSHSNPTYLFEYILGQIQSYDNLISPVVDSLKYLSSVSYDVLLFCVIEALSNPAKEHSKHEGTTISPWLLSLANFCGSVIKKYPIELPGLLQFITNQLKVGKCLDLLILKEIVQKMTGIETTEEMTDEQLEALSGGELLRSEGGSFNQVRNIKKSTLRLKEALLENNLSMALCILMAQQRNCILFQSENTHLKLIGKLYDHCQETLVQYGNFLSNSLSIDDYKRRLPSLQELILDFNLTPDVIFFLIRPMISHDITSIFEELLSGKSDKSKSFILECFIKASETVLNSTVDSIIPALSNIDLNPRFFVTFWTLTMYDVQVPEKSYFRERNKVNQQLQQLEENKEMAPSKKRKERERLMGTMAKLSNEAAQQTEHTTRVLARLDSEKRHWFESSTNKMDVTTNFLQHCLIPRCKFTALDALYCAKFVHLLHCIKTSNFSTLICFDRIFGDISYTMSSCTENEANHYGRFLCAILRILMRWHKDIKVFETECAKYPGFVTRFCDKDPVHIDYESYRHVCYKWHYRMTKAFILCLESTDYIQIRNSLIVLTKLLPHFPVMISFAQAIERRLDKIREQEKEKRPDLFVLATGYSGQLKLKKGTFIPESEFHEKENKKAPPVPPPPSQPEPSKSEPAEEAPKKEYKLTVEPVEKTQNKVKSSKRGSEIMEVDSKSKSRDSKMEYNAKKIKMEEKMISTVQKDGSQSRNESSRPPSVASSPKRTEYRSKEGSDGETPLRLMHGSSTLSTLQPTEKEYRKRKVESKAVDENDKRSVREENSQLRVSSYEKKSLRKRQNKDGNQDSPPESKRKKDDDKQLKRGEDRGESSRKTTDRNETSKRTSSRRYKQEEEK